MAIAAGGLGLLAAMLGRLSPNTTAREFCAGAAEMTTTALVIGFVASRHGAAFLDRGFTRHAVLSLSAVSAVVVIVKTML